MSNLEEEEKKKYSPDTDLEDPGAEVSKAVHAGLDFAFPTHYCQPCFELYMLKFDTSWLL